MRRLINYLRSCFCKHDWEREEKLMVAEYLWGLIRDIKVSLTCKKCGYHKTFWKFL